MVISGRAVLLALAGVIPVIFVPQGSTIVLWTGFVLVLILADCIAAASPRAFAVRRQVPRSLRLSTATDSVLTLTNEGSRRGRGIVRDAWQPSAGVGGNRHRFSLPTGESARMRTPLQPTRRGILRGDRVTIRCYGPLGLAARQRSIDVPTRLRVLPEFSSRQHLPSRLARLREMDGRSAVQIRGAGTEFDSLREYVDGDDVRSIDWRATARRSQVVVRTWRPERDRHVVVLVDTSRTSAVRLGDAPRLEANIEAALLLTALAGHAGDRIDLLAGDRIIRTQASGSGGPTLLATMADAVTELTPRLIEPDWPRLVSAASGRLRARSLVVLLTPLTTSSVENGLLPVVGQLTTRHEVVLASASDPDLTELAAHRGSARELYAAAAVERDTLERGALRLMLQRRGVTVVEATPDELAPQVADTYLALKAAGRL